MCGDAQEETTLAEPLWLPVPGSAPCHQPFISVNAPSPSSGSQEDWDLNITRIPAAARAGLLCESHQLWSTSKGEQCHGGDRPPACGLCMAPVEDAAAIPGKWSGAPQSNFWLRGLPFTLRSA